MEGGSDGSVLGANELTDTEIEDAQTQENFVVVACFDDRRSFGFGSFSVAE